MPTIDMRINYAHKLSKPATVERWTSMKRAANLSVDAKLLDEAKALAINLSQTFEQALKACVREEQARRWREENRAALESYADYIERHGVFSDGLRSF